MVGVGIHDLVFVYHLNVILYFISPSNVGFFVHGQLSGSFFYKKYPYCPITAQDIIKTSDGICDGGVLNTIGRSLGYDKF